MDRTVILSGEKFKYTITKKRIKNTYLRIGSDETIKVSCPKYVTISQIEDLLHKEEPYIRKALDRMREKKREAVNSSEYRDGDVISLFGANVRISVLPGNTNSVYYKDGTLNVLLTDVSDDDLRKNTVDRYLDEEGGKLILKTVDEVYPLFRDVVKVKPVIRLRRTKSQWGSCTPSKNALSFNLHLVHYPLECTRYVVIHEFSHFIYFNHSKDFYKEIEKRMPDYDKWRRLLKKSGTMINSR